MSTVLFLTQRTRSLMRYHGGKWKLAPWIITHFPPHRIYTEAFGGAASVLLTKERAYSEVYNDLDGDVVNLFRVLQCPETEARLLRALALTPYARAEYVLAQEPASAPVERARRLLVRAQMGFGSAGANVGHNTGFRSNVTRSFTTPAHDWATYPPALALHTTRLRGVLIENRPAVDVLTAKDSPETLHYIDPPYVLATRSDHARQNQCYAHEMDDAAHAALLDVVVDLRGMVVLSGYPSALYDEALTDWHRVERRAFGDARTERTEVLWLNPACYKALCRQRVTAGWAPQLTLL